MTFALITILVFMGLITVLTYWGAGVYDRQQPNRPELTSDPAQEELRMRYARGEIEREEFLQRKIDLE